MSDLHCGSGGGGGGGPAETDGSSSSEVGEKTSRRQSRNTTTPTTPAVAQEVGVVLGFSSSGVTAGPIGITALLCSQSCTVVLSICRLAALSSSTSI